MARLQVCYLHFYYYLSYLELYHASFSGGSDYSFTNGELIFEVSTEPMACTNGLLLLQDNILEHVENLFLSLESSDEDVRINPTFSQLTIEIEDANCMLLLCICFDLNCIGAFPFQLFN